MPAATEESRLVDAADEMHRQQPCCCRCCCKCCQVAFRCLCDTLRAFFLPPINDVTILPEFVRLVKASWILTLGVLTFACALNAAAILYVVKMFDHFFKGPLPSISQVVSVEGLMFQFYISLGILFVAPIAFFTLIFWSLYRACRNSPRIQKVRDRFDKKGKRPRTEGGGAPAEASASTGRSVFQALTSPFSRSEDTETRASSSPGGINVGGSELSAGVYERYEIGRLRKMWFCVALFGVMCFMMHCSICMSGVMNWGGSGIIFLLRVRDDTATLYKAAGMTPPPSLSHVQLIICACGIAATNVWFITLVLALVLILVPIVKEFRRQHSCALLLIPLFFAAAFLAFLLYEIIKDNESREQKLGRRLCFVNSCPQLINVGQVGAATGISCSNGCPAGTVCNPGNQLCHFNLKFDRIFLGANGGSQCVEFDFEPVVANIYPITGGVVHTLTQWSGAIYASGDCDSDTGICQTALCPECRVFNGPVGPVTQAEMTLLVEDRDYYDVTIINGANIPMRMFPIIERKTLIRPDPNSPPEYYCQSPGATGGAAAGAAERATWAFAIPQGTNRYPLVTLGSGTACASTAECRAAGEVCGTAMDRNERGKPLPTVHSGVCGKLVGMWSDDELCSWTAATTFGDCLNSVPGGPPGSTFQQMFACDGAYSVSCFQNTASSDCCGCTVWESLGLTETMTCHAVNDAWMQQAMPRLEFLKRACPTCYTYPFDDSTSLFTCQSNATRNDLSYTIEWCPSGTEITLA